MENYLSLCIWGNGPGRPYDNVYILKNITCNNGTLHLLFQGDEECIISNPQGVVFSEEGLKINNADRIIWKFYCYGRAKSNETLTVTQYTMMNTAQVHILEEGAFNSEKIVPKKGKAFDSFGDISLLLKNGLDLNQ